MHATCIGEKLDLAGKVSDVFLIVVIISLRVQWLGLRCGRVFLYDFLHTGILKFHSTLQ
jgi:hypothetical protein